MNDSICTDLAVLHQLSQATTEQEVKDLDLKNRLKKVVSTGWVNGYGLTAIQIGIPARYAWFALGNKEYELVNPAIEMGLGRSKVNESCLSIPGEWVFVQRYFQIEYRNKGQKRKAIGVLAQIIQHEIDHMDGILIIDKDGR